MPWKSCLLAALPAAGKDSLVMMACLTAVGVQMQLAQISDATGIALYGAAKCTVSNINMITAAGFG